MPSVSYNYFMHFVRLTYKRKMWKSLFQFILFIYFILLLHAAIILLSAIKCSKRCDIDNEWKPKTASGRN